MHLYCVVVSTKTKLQTPYSRNDIVNDILQSIGTLNFNLITSERESMRAKFDRSR